MGTRKALSRKHKLGSIDYRLDRPDDLALEKIRQTENPLIFACPFCKKPMGFMLLAKVKVSKAECAQPWICGTELQRARWETRGRVVTKQRRLEFHHHVPVSQFAALLEDYSNVQPLCNKCHHRIEMAQFQAMQIRQRYGRHR